MVKWVERIKEKKERAETLSDAGANPLVVLRSKAIRIQPFGRLHIESNRLVTLSIS
jgi:hypothetical protein